MSAAYVLDLLAGVLVIFVIGILGIGFFGSDDDEMEGY